MSDIADIFLMPDAGPLITLAYADSLHVLLQPGWKIRIVDMVLHEVLRNQTPTSEAIDHFVKTAPVEIVSTKIFSHAEPAAAKGATVPKKSNLGEFAIQEAMSTFALEQAAAVGVFLFEDHRIARASFLLPPQCQKVSTLAFLNFLEANGWIESASDISRRAILRGRRFSQMRFPSS